MTDAAIPVRETVVATVRIAVLLTALVIAVDLVDLPALWYAEIAKILVMIHALVIADQNVQIAVTLTVVDHVKEVVQAVATPTAVANVRVAVLVVVMVAQVAVMDVPVNYSCKDRME